MSKSRKQYSAKQKVNILRQHLVEGVPISDLCDQHSIQPRQFYQWQQTLFAQGELVFNRQPEQDMSRHAKEITALGVEGLPDPPPVLMEVGFDEKVALTALLAPPQPDDLLEAPTMRRPEPDDPADAPTIMRKDLDPPADDGDGKEGE